ncbi:unnamed protein product [Schistosoma spindalis]|nr:unnamed protein product [Schistosoma spindale]
MVDVRRPVLNAYIVLHVDIEWNFVKFLVDRNGTPVSRYSSITPPNSMEAEIRKLLGLSNEL